MAFRAVVHYPSGEKELNQLDDNITRYRLMIIREYLNKLDTCAENKVKIIVELLKNSE